MQIGYNCFVILPYFTPMEQEDAAVKQANQLIVDWLIAQNTEDRKRVVFMDFKSDQAALIVMLSQVSRLFVGHFVKYSVSKADFEYSDFDAIYKLCCSDLSRNFSFQIHCFTSRKRIL